MFNIFCWNVRGLNDLAKHRCVQSVVSNFFSSVACIQESKVDSVSRSFLRSCYGSGFDRCQYIPAIGASGDIITCWSSKFFCARRNFIEQVDGDGVRGVDDRCGSASEHVSGRWNKLDGGAARPLSGPPRARLRSTTVRHGGGAIRSRQGRPSSTIMRLGRGVGLLRLDRNAARLTLNAERTSSGLAAVRLGLRSTAVRLGLRPTAKATSRSRSGQRRGKQRYITKSDGNLGSLGADSLGAGGFNVGGFGARGLGAMATAALGGVGINAVEDDFGTTRMASEHVSGRVWDRRGATRIGFGAPRSPSSTGELRPLVRRGRLWSDAGGLGGDALGCGRRGATRAASERASVRRLARSDASGRGRRGAMRRCRRRRILMGENIRPLRHMSLKAPCPAWWVPVPGQLVVDEAHHAGVDRSAEMRGTQRPPLEREREL
uniref:Endonuclease/exonuclease/phosphatase domain-containing protein n=1 Tax=Ananas comosus var. bracteatus TaxID=296719 RepID=A0A6V7PHD8_ANACO|nr:unnamed protein product [Ananas comosus var. bracteatus]